MVERSWYRSVMDGQRAYLVERDGKTYVRLDRPDEEIMRPFVAAEWVPDFEKQPFTETQIAQVAFEADRRLCLALGLHDKARKEWPSLSDDMRIAWLRQGPAAPEVRAELYAAIMGALRGYT
jgi:hypothetical protein